MENRNMSRHDREEIYLTRGDITLGPFTRDEVAGIVKDGTVEPNWLARIGLEGRVFPARLLTQPRHRGGVTIEPFGLPSAATLTSR